MQHPLDRMNQYERLKTLLDHQEPDRVPCYINGMPIYSDFFQEFKKREDTLLDKYTDNEENVLLTPSGDFTTSVFFGADLMVRGTRIDYPKDQWISPEGNFVPHGEFVKGANDVELGTKITYFGRKEKIELLPNGYPYMWYVDGYLKTPEAIRNWFDTYGWPHELKVHEFGSDIIETNKKFAKQIHILPSFGPGLYENTWFMMGQDRFALFCRKEPELIQRIINSIKELIIHQIQKMKPLHPLAAFTCDDMGQKGRALISPLFHHKFFFEARKEICAAIHEIGAKAIMHSCGNIVELIPDLLEAGLDGWQTLEPASEIDNVAIKKKYGQKMSFWGAIDNNVLCFGSVKDVETSVKKTIQQLGVGGGFVAGPAHDYLNTKVDNALAMRDAILKHGTYPIK